MKETQLHSSFALKTCFLRLDPWPYLPSDIVILKIEFLYNLFNPVVTIVIVNEPPDTAESELENDMLGHPQNGMMNQRKTKMKQHFDRMTPRPPIHLVYSRRKRVAGPDAGKGAEPDANKGAD
ncbi:Uncharacterized protein Fot_49673 [Forsythia ovata]|uniref:Uncharacterized protein n=1 Tax=Forsythia ovata TaxID=205694 RepID=A0ABD1QCJ4_9LAMI